MTDKSNKTFLLSPPPPLQSPVNLGCVSAMTTALMEKSKLVSEWKVSMASSNMADFINLKLRGVVETDRDTGRLYPAMQEATVSVLEEIQHMFLAIAATAGSDVHHMSDNGLRVFNSMEETPDHRPSSVESQHLNDPQQYLHRRPRAQAKVLEDDMLHRPDDDVAFHRPKPQQMYKPNINTNFTY